MKSLPRRARTSRRRFARWGCAETGRETACTSSAPPSPTGRAASGEVRRISFRKERDAHTTTVEIYTTRLGTVFCAPCDLEHASASPQERIREWVRRANADEHMDLRELTDIANDMDAASHADDTCEKLSDLAGRIRKLAKEQTNE